VEKILGALATGFAAMIVVIIVVGLMENMFKDSGGR
jgi:hypothetical protein